jgi:hypothetical protein
VQSLHVNLQTNHFEHPIARQIEAMMSSSFCCWIQRQDDEEKKGDESLPLEER